MNPPKPLNDSEAEVIAVGDVLKIHTAPCLTTIIGAPDEDNGDLIGSGTFVKVDGRVFIVTAAHVAQKVWTYPYRAHSIGHAKRPILIEGFSCVDFPEDVAVAEIDPGDLEGTTVVPVDISTFAESSHDLADDFLFIHGFPEKQSKFFAMANGLVSETLAYTTFVGESSLPAFNPAVHFAIQYKPEKQKRADGVEVDLPPPPGLSGSAVWKLPRKKAEDPWDPSLAKIVGIAHTWDRLTGSLVATRVEVIRRLLNDAQKPLVIVEADLDSTDKSPD